MGASATGSQSTEPAFAIDDVIEHIKKDPRFSTIPRGSARLEAFRLAFKASKDRKTLIDALKALVGPQVLMDVVAALEARSVELPGRGVASAASDEDEVEITGERTREERDAEDKKRAVDLEVEPEAPAKVPRTVDPVPSGAGSSSAASLAEGLGEVAGLAKLVDGLRAGQQQAALAWCKQNDTASVKFICLLEKDDAFVASMRLTPGGMNESVLRMRLAAIRNA